MTFAIPPHLPPPKPDLSFTRKPQSPLAVFFWRRRMWFEATFVLSMLEPWEKLLLLTIFAILFFLVCSGIVLYLPQHLSIMKGRAMYYLYGQEGERALWQWLGYGVGGALHKEL
ncbi:hypothetical protein MKEN_00515900 [Mycena kentingensis (nom. inval.)]|nr:hypothetical protein MKEN_00515900 [Mycena kentingensis (nom. inval.)]